MSKKGKIRLVDRLVHIIEESDNIAEFIDGMDEQAFLSDKRTRRAVERSLGIIGESCNKLITSHEPFAEEHPEMDLGTARVLRHDLIHDYFLQPPSLWVTVTKNVPVLGQQAMEALRSLDPDLAQELESSKDKGPEFS